MVFPPQTSVREINVQVEDMKQYRPNRTIPCGVKSWKQVHHGTVWNKWQPNPCQTNEKMCKSYERLIQRMNQNGIKIKKCILNNEASEEFLQMIWWQGIKYQKVPSQMHGWNMAEKAISTFKVHFKAILAGIDKSFPMHQWDRLLPQAEHTLNMILPTNIAPKISAYAYLYGQHHFNKCHLHQWVVLC